MSRRVLATTSLSNPSTPSVTNGSLVKWNQSGDQLWIVLMVQGAAHVAIRTLPFSDGSFCTRTRPAEELTIVQSGSVMVKDITGLADQYAYKKE